MEYYDFRESFRDHCKNSWFVSGYDVNPCEDQLVCVGLYFINPPL